MASAGIGLDNHLKAINEHIVGHACGDDPLEGETYFPLGETTRRSLYFAIAECAK